MVTTGFSKPYIAKYSNSGTTVTYTGAASLGRGVSVSLDIETADDNDFYADNALAETETAQFTSGSATVTIDGLEPEAATLALGLPAAQEVTVGEKKVSFQAYGDDMNVPYLGFGFIRRGQMKGVVKYYPTIFPKVKFSLPGEEAETSEDTINWQTQELSASLLRDDTAKRNWKYAGEGLETEAEAEAALKAFLGATA